MFADSKRFIAKTVVSIAHHTTCVIVSTAAINAAVQPETETQEELVELGGLAVGTAIWWKTTDKVTSVVDVVADRRAARKARKQDDTEK
jgi:hypothetical protein